MPGLTLTEKSKATTSMRFSRVLGSKYKDSASHMHCLNWSTGSYYVVSVCVWQEQYRGLELILKKCLGLLKALARGNDFVQLTSVCVCDRSSIVVSNWSLRNVLDCWRRWLVAMTLFSWECLSDWTFYSRLKSSSRMLPSRSKRYHDCLLTFAVLSSKQTHGSVIVSCAHGQTHRGLRCHEIVLFCVILSWFFPDKHCDRTWEMRDSCSCSCML